MRETKSIYVKAVAVSIEDKEYIEKLYYEQPQPKKGRKKSQGGILSEIILFYRNNK